VTNWLAAASLGFSLVAIAVSQLVMKARLSVLVPQGPGLAGPPRLIGVLLGDPGVWLALALIVSSAATWYLAMTRLSVTWMMASASLVAPLVALGAHLWLGEPLSAMRAAAIAWIALGVLWFALAR
jgi:hypothetical protein